MKTSEVELLINSNNDYKEFFEKNYVFRTTIMSLVLEATEKEITADNVLKMIYNIIKFYEKRTN